MPAVPTEEDEKILDRNAKVIDKKKLDNTLYEMLGIDRKPGESSSIIIGMESSSSWGIWPQ